MKRRDHRHRNTPPDHAELLKQVGVAEFARHDPCLGVTCGQNGEALNIKPRAKSAPLARKNNRADALICQKRLPCSNEGLRHLDINPVHFISTGQRDMSDMIFDLGGNAGHQQNSSLEEA